MLLTEWVAFKDAKNSAVSEETTRLISNDGNGELPQTPPVPRETSTEEVEEDLPDVPEQAAAEVPDGPAEPVDSICPLARITSMPISDSADTP